MWSCYSSQSNPHRQTQPKFTWRHIHQEQGKRKPRGATPQSADHRGSAQGGDAGDVGRRDPVRGRLQAAREAEGAAPGQAPAEGGITQGLPRWGAGANAFPLSSSQHHIGQMDGSWAEGGTGRGFILFFGGRASCDQGLVSGGCLQSGIRGTPDPFLNPCHQGGERLRHYLKAIF